MDISFLLPTNRPYEHFAKINIDGINAFMENTDYTYEILVYAPFKVKGKNIKHIPESYSNTGPVHGYNESYPHSKGQYIFILNDDNAIGETALKAIPFLESDKYKRCKFKVTSVGAPDNFDYSLTSMPVLYNSNCGLRNYVPVELKHERFKEVKHTYPVLGYPVLTRDTVDKHLCGHIFNPLFHNHYADNWLPFYIGEMGEFPWVCEGTPVTPYQAATYSQDSMADFQTFCRLAVDLINGVNTNYV